MTQTACLLYIFYFVLRTGRVGRQVCQQIQFVATVYNCMIVLLGYFLVRVQLWRKNIYMYLVGNCKIARYLQQP